MSSESDDHRSELIATVGAAGRELGTWQVLFHDAIAERAGLGSADQRALDLLREHGPMSAGELARLTGMTTGAITKLTDRLEKAGFVHRVPDPADRRKVILHVDPERSNEVFGPLFAEMGRNFFALCAQYSNAELTLVLDFMLKATENLRTQARALRKQGD